MTTLRQALRALLAAPAFTLIAVLTLGLGIGANTAIFSVVDAILLRPLPLPHPEQLVSVRESSRQFPSMSVSYPNYLDWKGGNHTLSGLAAYRGSGGVLTQAGPPLVVQGREVSGNYFSVLGVQPALGRGFLPSEDVLGATDTIVLSASLFRERFGGDPRWLGKTLVLDAKPRVILGVMPPDFPGFGEPRFNQYFVPMGPAATKGSGMQNRDSHPGINCVGRLKPGASVEGARADLGGIARILAQEYPAADTDHGVEVKGFLDRLVGDTRPALLLLLGAVGLVLLIACANVANLMLARAAGRQKSFAIRAALGASRARLAMELLAESLWIGVLGSALGLGLAWAAMRLARVLIPASVPRVDGLALDGRIFVFALLLALVTSVLFGVAPALHASRARIAEVLKEGGRDATGGATGARLRGALVALEMGLALLLLAGAGLLVRSLVELQRVDPGFNPHNVLTYDVGLPDARYPLRAQRTQFFTQAMERTRNLPGVAAVGGIMPLPFSGNDWEEDFSLPDRPAPAPGHETATDFAMVAGDYFGAMGMRMLRGRAFNASDTFAALPVAIIDDTFARQYWPGQNPVGRQITLDGHPRTIVGEVAHVKNYGLDGESRVETFVPEAQREFGEGPDELIFTARTRGMNPLALSAGVAAAIQGLDSNQPLDDVQTMDERVDLSLAQRRLTLWIMVIFAALAATLAGIGIYGVMSYAVAQRSHEIGIRMALGAGRPRVLGMVMRQGLRLAVIGAGAGAVAALAAGRALSSFLYGVAAADPLTLGLVVAGLLAVAALACYVPARRATAVDPNEALRYE